MSQTPRAVRVGAHTQGATSVAGGSKGRRPRIPDGLPLKLADVEAYLPPGPANDTHGSVARAALEASLDRVQARRAPTAAVNWHTAFLEQRAAYFGDPIHLLHWCAVLDDDPLAQTAVDRAARLGVAAIELQRTVAAGIADTAPPYAWQYANAFTNCAPVGEDENLLESTLTSSHFVLLLDGVVHRVGIDSLGDPGSIFDAVALHTELAHVIAAGRGPGSSPCAATSMPRGDWCLLRNELLMAPVGSASLRDVETAAFCLAVDTTANPLDTEETGRLAHSGGAANRWHDKSLQIVVFGNGKAAVVGSFGAGVEGSAAISLAADLATHARNVEPGRQPTSGAATISTRELAWDLNEAQIEALARVAQKSAPTHQRAWFTFPFDTAALRRSGISPDACFHVALHLALVRLFAPGLGIEQREFVGLHDFEMGSATSRSVCTPAVTAFVEAAIASESGPGVLLAALRSASDVHRDEVRRARNGMLPLQRLTALAEEDEELRLAFEQWVDDRDGIVMDMPFFWTSYGVPVKQWLLVLTSGLSLVPGVRIAGRLGITWPLEETLCVHYFIGPDEIDVVFHSAAELQAHWAEIASALGRAIEFAAAVGTGEDHARPGASLRSVGDVDRSVYEPSAH